MAPTYQQPSVEPIAEDSEDESSITRPRGEIRAARGSADPSSSSRYQEKETKERMAPARMSATKTKSRRSHKSSSSSCSSSSSAKHSSRTKGKPVSSGSIFSSGDRELYTPHRRRHVRTRSGRYATSGDSSDSDGEKPIEDHRDILAAAAARGRLTSPSMFSIQTALTTATNTSSGSSGSNSTVTQASISKNENEKIPEQDQAPPSPAVPDPPDVFSYMEQDSVPESFAQFAPPTSLPHVIKQARHPSTSSASSLHSDNISEPAVDVDTDRSTSPERSVKGKNDDESENSQDVDARSNHENDGYSSNTSAKYESQLKAAKERQNLHERRAQPNASNHPQQFHSQQPMIFQTTSPRQIQAGPAMDIPLSGYDLIAQTISNPSRTVPPIYRRFEALNHRVLLSLQDEIMELEEQLKGLDDWDTNSRSYNVSVSVPREDGNADRAMTVDHSNGPSTRIARHIHPSSRRHEARYPSEVSYPKSQLLQTLQYKLAQYNLHLKSFNDTSNLSRPRGQEVEEYRQFLNWEKPVIDAEAGYMSESVESDLVILGNRETSEVVDRYPVIRQQRRLLPSPSSISDEKASQPSDTLEDTNPLPIPLPTLATALAAAFLIPILTFGPIPNWLGRMTVVLLVGLGVWGGIWQSLAARNGEGREWIVGRDGLVIAGVYGSIMAVVAAIIR